MYYFGMTWLEVSTLWFTFLVVLYRLSFWLRAHPADQHCVKNLAARPVEYGIGIGWGPPWPGERLGIALGSTILEYRTLVHLIGLGEGHEVSTLSLRETAADVVQFLIQAGELGEGGREDPGYPARPSAPTSPAGSLSRYVFTPLCITLLALLPALLSQASRKSSTMQIK